MRDQSILPSTARKWGCGNGGGGGEFCCCQQSKRGGLKKVVCQSTANKGGIIRIILSLMKASDDFIAT